MRFGIKGCESELDGSRPRLCGWRSCRGWDEPLIFNMSVIIKSPKKEYKFNVKLRRRRKEAECRF